MPLCLSEKPYLWKVPRLRRLFRVFSARKYFRAFQTWINTWKFIPMRNFMLVIDVQSLLDGNSIAPLHALFDNVRNAFPRRFRTPKIRPDFSFFGSYINRWVHRALLFYHMSLLFFFKFFSYLFWKLTGIRTFWDKEFFPSEEIFTKCCHRISWNVFKEIKLKVGAIEFRKKLVLSLKKMRDNKT